MVAALVPRQATTANAWSTDAYCQGSSGNSFAGFISHDDLRRAVDRLDRSRGRDGEAPQLGASACLVLQRVQPELRRHRDFNPFFDYEPDPADLPGSTTGFGFFITPEAQASGDGYQALEAEFGLVDVFVDLRNEGTCHATNLVN